MSLDELFQQIKKKKSFLCVGLDVDIDKLPSTLSPNPGSIFEFSKQIIDAVAPYAVAIKPNLAFFEVYGSKGWEILELLMNYIDNNYPELFTIADAKRGDIGTSSEKYAHAFFKHLKFNAVTVSPYMGQDSVEPFLMYPDKHVILLSSTSNPGSQDFQIQSGNENNLFEKVIQKSQTWSHSEKLWYVVGATRSSHLKQIRKLVPHNYLLVPGIGVQGGHLSDVVEYGINEQCGLIVNASRSIIYSSNGSDFAHAAMTRARSLQFEMESFLKKHELVK